LVQIELGVVGCTLSGGQRSLEVGQRLSFGVVEVCVGVAIPLPVAQ
jgi:hypothetical protein